MDTILTLSSPQKSRKLGERLQREVTHVRGLDALLRRLEAEDMPLLVIVDIAQRSLRGENVFERLSERIRGDPLLLVRDLDSFDPRRLLALLGLMDKPASASTRTRGAVLQPALHHPKSGRIDANLVAEFLGLSSAKLAKLLDRSPQSVHKTPDAKGLQRAGGLFAHCRRSHGAIGRRGKRARLAQHPNSDLNGVSPQELIEGGHAEIVADLVEDALLGHPG